MKNKTQNEVTSTDGVGVSETQSNKCICGNTIRFHPDLMCDECSGVINGK